MKIAEGRAQCLSFIPDDLKKRLMPREQWTGMKDWVKECGCGWSYLDYWYWAVDNSRIEDGGLLVHDENDIDSAPFMDAFDFSFDKAQLLAYEKYLCRDGAIRYRPQADDRQRVSSLAAALREKEDNSWS